MVKNSLNPTFDILFKPTIPTFRYCTIRKLFLLLQQKDMDFILDYLHQFWYLTLEMAPYLLLGFIIVGLLKAFVPQGLISKHLSGSSRRTAIYAALIGIPLPLCSCGVIPTGVALRREGASHAATVSFLISTPQTGVDSIAATYSVLGFPFAILRVIAALFTGVFGGLWAAVADQKSNLTKTEGLTSSCTSTTLASKNRWTVFFQYAFIEFMQDIAKWLIMGLALAALITTLVPKDFFLNYVSSPWLMYVLILFISIPLYVCATGSIPVAAALMACGISPGSALMFLMAGPATNAATLTVLLKALGKKTTLIYLASIVSGAFIFGLITDFLLPPEWFSVYNGSNRTDSSCCSPGIFPIVSGVVLYLLLLNSLIYPFYTRNKKQSADVTLQVTGMGCSHCKHNIESALLALEGITTVDADPVSGTVCINGKKIDLDIVQQTIQKAGYKVISYNSHPV